MAILVDKDTRLICQGFTGKQASFYSERAIATGTQMVGGVSPGKGGQLHLGLPVFNTVTEAMANTNANATVVLVPPAHAANAILEAIEAMVPLIVCITERIPLLDMVRVRSALANSTCRLVGPNCPGVVTPGECKVGIMPLEIFKPGRIGIVSRSSTLTYEAVMQTTQNELGQSTCIGIGADPVGGLSFVEVLELFNDDEATDGVVLIGEIGGSAEEQVADFLQKNQYQKPIVAYIAGEYAPLDKRMGHAGAIQQIGVGTAATKKELLERSGVLVAKTLMDIGQTMITTIR